MANKEKLPGYSYTDSTDMGADDALLSPESKEIVRQAKADWQRGSETGDKALMDRAHATAEAERAKYDYSGGANGGGYIGLTPTVGEPNYGTPDSQYKTAMDRAIQTLQGRGKFSYDPETDPLYQSYKDQFTRLGKTAMEDTYGNNALRTGGLGGSAAVSAGQQAYNGYMQALSDKIPELQQIAYQMWLDEENSLRRDIDMFSGLDQTTWDRWNSDRNFQRGAFESDRSFNYNKGLDQWNMVRQLDRDAKADAETEYQHGQDARNWGWMQDERSYKRSQDDYEKALDRASYLASSGNFSALAELWGLSEDETKALVTEYTRQQKAASSGGYRGGGGGVGSPADSDWANVERIYRLAQENGGSDPAGWIEMNYKALGIPYNSITSVASGYQAWMNQKAGEAIVSDPIWGKMKSAFSGKAGKSEGQSASHIRQEAGRLLDSGKSRGAVIEYLNQFSEEQLADEDLQRIINELELWK